MTDRIQNILVIFLQLAALPLEGILVSATVCRLFQPAKGRVKVILSYFLFALAAQLPSWIGDENTLILLPVFFGVFFICYQGTRAARFVAGSVFYLLLIPVNMLVDTLERWNAWEAANLVSVLLKLAYAAILLLLVRRMTGQDRYPALPERLWWLCGMLSLAPMIATLSFSLWNGFARQEIDDAQLRLAFTVLPFVVLSAAALLAAIIVLAKYESFEQAAQLAQMREMYYEGLQTQETQVRTLRHDLRNHLAVLQGFLKSGDTQQAGDYLAELTDSPALHGVRRICENETANVVLSCKMEQMERRGIRPDFLVTLAAKLPLPNADLSSLLGNALDNAMEAAALAEDKTVLLRLRADHGMLMLRVENAYAREPFRTKTGFRTSKSDSAGHGLGIRAMQALAEQYHGTMETKAENGRFELLVCVPLA